MAKEWREAAVAGDCAAIPIQTARLATLPNVFVAAVASSIMQLFI